MNLATDMPIATTAFAVGGYVEQAREALDEAYAILHELQSDPSGPAVAGMVADLGHDEDAIGALVLLAADVRGLLATLLAQTPEETDGE